MKARPKPVMLLWFGICLASGSARAVSQTADDALRPFWGYPGIGARSIGMGGAQVSATEGYAASFWNPAALGLLRRGEIYGSLGQLEYDSETEFSGTLRQAEEVFTGLDAVGAAYPYPVYRGSLVIALGRNTLRRFDGVGSSAGLSPTDGAEFREEGALHAWSGAFGVQVAPSAFFGVSLSYLFGSDDYTSESTNSVRHNLLEIRPEFSGFALTLGGLVTGGDNVKAGVVVRGPTFVKVKEDWSNQATCTDCSSPPVFSSGKVEYRMTLPYQFEGGVSVRIWSVILSADVRLVDWGQIEFDSEAVDEDRIPIEPGVERDIADRLRATTGIRLGVEVGVPRLPAWVRAGYREEPSPFKGLEEGEHDRQFLSGGVGIRLSGVMQMDVAYEHGWWGGSVFDPALGLTADEDVTLGRLFLSLSYLY